MGIDSWNPHHNLVREAPSWPHVAGYMEQRCCTTLLRSHSWLAGGGARAARAPLESLPGWAPSSSGVPGPGCSGTLPIPALVPVALLTVAFLPAKDAPLEGATLGSQGSKTPLLGKRLELP